MSFQLTQQQSGYKQKSLREKLSWALLLIFAINISCFNNTQAQPATPKEYQIKAAFLYKFSSYVEWPDKAFASPDSPFIIGVVGADELADSLEKIISGRTINGRPVEIRKLLPETSFANVQMLFVGRSENPNLAGILTEAQQLPVLTVTESEESLALGSVINFVITEDKVRFDIALGSADRNHLKISSRLLEVARKVISGSS